jgi:hypothetical protein
MMAFFFAPDSRHKKASVKKRETAMAKEVVSKTQDMITVNLNRAIELLGRCTRVEDAKKHMDMGVAAKVWVKRRQLGVEAQNTATELVLRAERHIGELLKQQPERHRGGRPGKKPVTREGQVSTLKQAGISRNLSSRAQKLASVPPEKFDAVIRAAKKQGQEISGNEIVKQLTRPAVPDVKRPPRDKIADAVIVTETASPAEQVIARIRTFIEEQLETSSDDVRVAVALALRDYASGLMKYKRGKLEVFH